MTKEELEKEYYAYRPTEPYSEDDSPNNWANIAHYAEENLDKAFKAIIELEKENAVLKEKISILLSCKNCPENKGGWICIKEYENKCLTQKIAYIKELQKENTELKSKNCWKTCEYAEPKSQWISQHIQDIERLTKAKELIRRLHDIVCGKSGDDWELIEKAEQFLKELEE